LEGTVEKASVPTWSVVERTNKTDRVVRAFNVRGADTPSFSVEITSSRDAAVTIVDRNGSILYRASPTERTTIVAKRAAPPPVLPASKEIGSSDAESQLPDGCESAFSPYVEPGMANVIGRCVSVRMAGLSR
jgi:hypothetical protein